MLSYAEEEKKKAVQSEDEFGEPVDLRSPREKMLGDQRYWNFYYFINAIFCISLFCFNFVSFVIFFLIDCKESC
jgi:hypothetical protein